MIINLGNDNIEYLKKLYKNPKSFSVYIGSHGDLGAKLADLVLPVSAWTE
jgi:hypothetical protein